MISREMWTTIAEADHELRGWYDDRAFLHYWARKIGFSHDHEYNFPI